MANLYELLGNYEMLSRAIDDPDVDMEATLDAFDEVKGSLREKVDNICRLLSSLDNEVKSYKREEARLEARRKARENNIARLREWVRITMDVLDIDSLKTSLHQVSLQTGSQKLVVRDEKLVPEEFMRTKREVDKAGILRAYRDDGEVVPGTEVVRGERKLVIR